MQTSGRRFGRLLVGAAVIAATGAFAPTAATAAGPGTSGEAQNYLVLFKGSSSPADAPTIVTGAGGTVVANYSQIGVLVARSGNSAFGDTVRANSKVEGAAATANYATQLSQPADDGTNGSTGDLPNAPSSDADSLSALQWDMRQINARRRMPSPGAARLSWSATSTPGSTSTTLTCGRTSTWPTA